MVNAIANFAVRGFQVIFAACITGLFVDLARGHKWDGTPITLGYTAFVGCVSLIAAFLGIAGEFIQFLQGYIGLALDGFIGLLNLAGGVLVAIKLDGVKCSNDYGDKGAFDNRKKMIENTLFNGGVKKIDGDEACYYCDDVNKIVGNCKKVQAGDVFMFLQLVMVLVSATLIYLRLKKGY